MILHLRVVPGLPSALAERDQPDLRSFPLIVGDPARGRGAVLDANMPARRAGIRPGMTLAQARGHCPEARVIPPDLQRYDAVWEEICEILRLYTPLVEPLERGEAICDLTGCERLWGDAWTVAGGIVAAVRERVGLPILCGIAANRLTAQLASATAGVDGITLVAAGQERRFLADLPVSLLPELDPRTALAFHVLGLRTIGQLASLPAQAVTARFGPEGKRLHAFACGIDPRPVVPPPTRPSVSVRRDCEDGTLEGALAVLQRLSEECARELQDRELAGSLIELRLLWEGEPPDPSAPQLHTQERRCLPSRDISRRPSHTGNNPEVGERSRDRGRHMSHREGRHRLSERNQSPLPISYRVHSMLPQPGTGLRRRDDLVPRASEEHVSAQAPPAKYGGRERIAVRVPVNAAPQLLEHAQRLLLRCWPKDERGMPREAVSPVLELRVAEFEEPVQLALDGLTGMSGFSPERRQKLAAGEDILLARYGGEPFRHVAAIDPGSVLAERRFRWGAGLPPTLRRGAGRRPASRPRRRR